MTWIDLGWQDRAACLGEDLAVFFGHGEDGQTHREQKRAKRICAGCPVRRECLEHALGRPERHGWWGGLNQSEREAVLKQRRRRARAERERQSALWNGQDAYAPGFSARSLRIKPAT